MLVTELGSPGHAGKCVHTLWISDKNVKSSQNPSPGPELAGGRGGAAIMLRVCVIRGVMIKYANTGSQSEASIQVT